MKQPTEWLEPPFADNTRDGLFHCMECGSEWFSYYRNEYLPDGTSIKILEQDGCPTCSANDYELIK